MQIKGSVLTDSSGVFWQVIRYLSAGAAAFLLDFTLMFVMHEIARINLAISTLSAGITVFFVNFVIQQKFTFRSRAKTVPSFVWYVALVSFNLIATVVIVQIGEYFGNWIAGKIVASLIIPFWNYFAYRFLIFRK